MTGIGSYLRDIEDQAMADTSACRDHLVSHGALPADTTLTQAEDWLVDHCPDECDTGCPFSFGCPLQ